MVLDLVLLRVRALLLPTNTGEKRIACRICGKAFADRSALGRQKLIQSGEKPFACVIYGKAFAYRSALVMSVFKEFKSFEERTRQSGETFEFRILVSNHMTHKFIHNGEKLCLQNLWKIFRTQPLFIHAQIEFRHAGEMAFSCPICWKQGGTSPSEFKSFEERTRRSGETFEFRILVSNHMTNKFIHNGEKLLAEFVENLSHTTTIYPRTTDNEYALPKFDANEILTDPDEFRESEETPLLTDFVPGSTDNNNQTSSARARDQIEVSEDEGPIRKRKNSRSHCQQKKRFTCGVCGKSLSTKQSLQYHEFTHTGEKPFACRVCGKSFAQRGHLSTHKLIHKFVQNLPRTPTIYPRTSGHMLEKGNSVAVFVGKDFEAGRDFTITKRNTLKRLSPVMLCVISLYEQICGKAFDDSSALGRHKLIHSGEKRFACRICGKAFDDSSALGRHKWIHSGEKPFACRVCGKGFRSKVGYQGHTKEHCEEEKSVCALCGDPFRLPEDLEKHLKWHIQSVCCCTVFCLISEIVPLECCYFQLHFSHNERLHQKGDVQVRICGKAFADMSALGRHKLIQSGEKSPDCRICGKLFADRSALCRQKLIQSGEKRFACRICGNAVADRSALVTSGFEKFKSLQLRTRRKVKRSNFELGFQLAPPASSSTIEGNSAWKICGKYFAHNHHLSTHKLTPAG
ncbi:unnamed protein product [Cyprideis torosa]|uniref:Uncharacterized protein n=1 Tax=Cyprideis torosa TaxID=163714 RepID=A0A7R8WG55_9CRUS|nr:unnamed protein product [Cyprideis torosa]CAG0894916.1 unnamed protein product [Cyprideis torosa]